MLFESNWDHFSQFCWHSGGDSFGFESFCFRFVLFVCVSISFSKLQRLSVRCY